MKQVTLTSNPDLIIPYLKENVPKDFAEYQDGINEEHVRSLFACGALAYISVEDEQVTGVLVFMTADNLAVYPGKRVAVEHIWHSKGRTGHLLIKAYEDYAKGIGCSYVFMCAHENAHAEKVKGIYNKLSYRLLESTYIKEL